ncbi:hypothetical protein AVEN_189327-1 [Araneus ventricosus]|uniref:Uncharacterized protein n=1 Tax=Araneus ventricosus TaxID=182803 RepID=A0A4Y2GHX1_ARAVE|nr:hypothetical protein AVEN_189327-1 [Araneus ventricosus]
MKRIQIVVRLTIFHEHVSSVAKWQSLNFPTEGSGFETQFHRHQTNVPVSGSVQKGVLNEVSSTSSDHGSELLDDDADTINSVGSYKGNLGYFHDRPLPKSKLGIRYVYPKAQEGFVPADLSALNNVYWWKKRYGSSAVDDAPFYRDEDKNNFVTVRTGIKKRDYTAAQLVNMLKALAKTRRQRQIRIAGKGLRFGISK